MEKRKKEEIHSGMQCFNGSAGWQHAVEYSYLMLCFVDGAHGSF